MSNSKQSDVIIRVALPEDVLEISKLWQMFMEYNAQFDYSFKVQDKITGRFARELQHRIDDPNYRLTVAEVDKELVGYSLSYVSKKPYFFKLGKFGFIGDLFVLEQHRRKGYGRLLVDDAVEFFKRKNINQIELLVADENINTVKFWEEMGYKTLLRWMYKKL